jgi:crotonobetainyl-CoA:carnitine CoA-transferase CaiB-like acyl-CoA transferase
VGLLAAVIQRQSTGLGQHIDIAMIDATVFTDDQIHYALEDSEHTGPLPNEVWTTGAGPVLISAELRFIWHLFSTQLGIADPASKETPLAEKIAARHAVVSDYLAELATWSEVEQKMDELNLAWGVVRDPADIRNQATVAARGAIVEVDDRAGGTRPVTQSPYRFSNARSGVRGGAPHRGEHNFEVLTGWLGKTEADVHVLRDQGVLLEDEQTLGKR